MSFPHPCESSARVTVDISILWMCQTSLYSLDQSEILPDIHRPHRIDSWWHYHLSSSNNHSLPFESARIGLTWRIGRDTSQKLFFAHQTTNIDKRFLALQSRVSTMGKCFDRFTVGREWFIHCVRISQNLSLTRISCRIDPWFSSLSDDISFISFDHRKQKTKVIYEVASSRAKSRDLIHDEILQLRSMTFRFVQDDANDELCIRNSAFLIFNSEFSPASVLSPPDNTLSSDYRGSSDDDSLLLPRRSLLVLVPSQSVNHICLSD